MASITIEIADECNRSVMFHPIKQKLRGRWDRQRVAYKRPHQALTRLPEVIPGIQISVDIHKKARGYRDPLSDPQHVPTLEAIKLAKEEVSGITPGVGPWPAVVYEGSSDSDLKTWLYWMRRLVNSKSAVIISPADSLPSLEEIDAMRGDVFIGQFNEIITRKITKDEGKPQPVAAKT